MNIPIKQHPILLDLINKNNLIIKNNLIKNNNNLSNNITKTTKTKSPTILKIKLNK